MKFVEEFSTHFDGARAVRAAGYTASTDTAARHVASTLTARPRVQEALTRRRNAPAAELELSKSNIRKLLTHLLFLDPLDFMAPLPDGRWVVRDMTQVPPWARLAISYCKSTMRYSKDGSPILTSEIKWVDKGLLLQLAMKYKGMLGDREDNKSVHGPTAEFVAQMMNTKIPPTMVVQQHEIERRLTIVPSVVPREEIPDEQGTDASENASAELPREGAE
jgi:hypothetical protein